MFVYGNMMGTQYSLETASMLSSLQRSAITGPKGQPFVLGICTPTTQKSSKSKDIINNRLEAEGDKLSTLHYTHNRFCIEQGNVCPT